MTDVVPSGNSPAESLCERLRSRCRIRAEYGQPLATAARQRLAPVNGSGEPGRLRRLPALRATSESVSDPDLVRAAASHRGTAAAAPVNGSVEKGRLRSLPSLLALWVRRNVGDLLCLSRQRFSWRVAKTRQPSRLHEGTDEEICIVPSLTVDRSRHSRGRASPSRKVGRVG